MLQFLKPLPRKLNNTPCRLFVTTLDNNEINRFSGWSNDWWNPNGTMRALHDINPPRLIKVREILCSHFQLDPLAVKPLTGLKIVDVGCGCGLLSESLARLGGNVTGVDPSSSNVVVASTHANLDGSLPNCNFELSSAEQLVDEGKLYDVVISLEVIEHVSNMALFLTSCASLLSDNGIFVLSTLNKTIKSLLLAKIGAEYILNMVPKGTHDWEKFVTPEQIDEILKSQNLERILIEGMVIDPLSKKWYFSKNDLDVNYMVAYKKKE